MFDPWVQKILQRRTCLENPMDRSTCQAVAVGLQGVGCYYSYLAHMHKITDSVDMSLSKHREVMENREASHAGVGGVIES